MSHFDRPAFNLRPVRVTKRPRGPRWPRGPVEPATPPVKDRAARLGAYATRFLGLLMARTPEVFHVGTGEMLYIPLADTDYDAGGSRAVPVATADRVEFVLDCPDDQLAAQITETAARGETPVLFLDPYGGALVRGVGADCGACPACRARRTPSGARPS